MEDNFYKDEFERFLQEQADNHRMYPSDSIWRNIDKRLHGDKKWPALTIAAFTFLAAVVAISFYFSPGPNIFAVTTPQVPPTALNNTSTPMLAAVSNATDKRATNWNYNKVIREIIDTQLRTNTTTFLNEQNEVAVAERAERSIQKRTLLRNINNLELTRVKPATISLVPEQAGAALVNIFDEDSEGDTSTATLTSSPADIEQPTTKAELPAEKSSSSALPNISQRTSSRTKKPGFSYTVYITPSRSYRELEESTILHQKQSGFVNGPVALNQTADVNKIVRHIPGNGVEAGVTLGYNFTNSFKVTSGLQFNVRQYYIEAFVTHPEVATIALQSSAGIDTINLYSIYRTSNGYSPTELINRYYQVSAPVGLEWKVIGSKDISLNVAANVQPTYNINNESYLLSTNFKNYTQTGGMLRNWNINTAVAAFLNINSGNFNWQVGPQFRYQQLPTFTRKYPIKEHLLDYGVRVGISRSIH